MLASYYQAFRARDVDTIMTMYWRSPRFVAFDIVPPLRFVGWDAYKKDWQAFFLAFKGRLTDDPITFKLVVDGRIAYSEGTERMTGTLTDGTRTTIIVRATDVYRKIGGRWFIVHEHVSVPVDFTTGKAIFNARDH